MYDDVESDFWKDIFVHLQHKNMMRIGAERLTLQECPDEFQAFIKRHPLAKPEITNSGSFCTWEIFVTENIKLRLFIQTQIKGSLLQKKGGDLEKICDAKFPNNPFPEIEEFLSKKDSYLKELYTKKVSASHMEKQLKLLAEFVKVYASKHFENSDCLWEVKKQGQELILEVRKGNDTRCYKLSISNFKSEIDSIDI